MTEWSAVSRSENILNLKKVKIISRRIGLWYAATRVLARFNFKIALTPRERKSAAKP